MEYMRTLPDKAFDLAIVDPPYGISIHDSGRLKKYNATETRWDDATPGDVYFSELKRCSKNQIIWGGNYYDLPPCRGFVIWDKKQPEDISFASCEFAWTSFDTSARTLSTVLKDNPICEPVIEKDESGHYAISVADGKKYPVYEVRNGLISIKEKQYQIKLADGFYIIRKLTVRECMRLQTVPETYALPVCDTQAYKMLGNGWTVDVIAHLLSHFDGLTEEPVEVLSMYDGMSCGHIALDKLGANVAAYYATEIDKYAIQTTQHNFPETVQLGDAFQVRKEDWTL
jgi:hypothetical protein